MNTIKKVFLAALIAAGAVLLLYFSFPGKSGEMYRVEVFEAGNGWGYRILKEDKTIIEQPCMPGIKGNIPFPDEVSARDIGELVLLKIKKNEDPSITPEELKKKLSIPDHVLIQNPVFSDYQNPRSLE